MVPKLSKEKAFVRLQEIYINIFFLKSCVILCGYEIPWFSDLFIQIEDVKIYTMVCKCAIRVNFWHYL